MKSSTGNCVYDFSWVKRKKILSLCVYQSLVYWLLLLFSFRNTRNVDKKKNTVHKSDKIFQEYWIFLSRTSIVALRRVCWSKFFLFFPPQISFVLRARGFVFLCVQFIRAIEISIQSVYHIIFMRSAILAAREGSVNILDQFNSYICFDFYICFFFFLRNSDWVFCGI